ncbi:MAG: helix-turn-helix transcriptional regulator [Phycisphaerales bacterium]|nr:helix-turn-helix transcriptional regulator [Phycisphaerales bacterium]
MMKQLSSFRPDQDLPSRGGGTHLPTHLSRTLQLLRGGMTQREIAARLGISFNSVHKYVQEIYQHFGVRGRVQLLSQMLRHPQTTGKCPISAHVSTGGKPQSRTPRGVKPSPAT